MDTRTLCSECGKVLTCGARRLASANFDSALKKKRNTNYIIYAHCDDCYARLKEALRCQLQHNKL